MLASDCDLGITFLTLEEFSHTSLPWPEKLRTVPLVPAPRFPLKTWKLLPAEDPPSAGPLGVTRPEPGPTNECHRPSAVAGGAEAEFPKRCPPPAGEPPGRYSLPPGRGTKPLPER